MKTTMHEPHFVDNIIGRINNLTDESVYSIMYALKSISVAVVFIGVVVAWDTLPSIPPIQVSDIDLRSVYSGKTDPALSETVVVDYKYRVLKMVDFQVHYSLTNESKAISLQMFEQSRAHESLTTHEESFQKMFVLNATGKWCLDTKIIWTNGLSLRKHEDALKQVCFEV